MEIFSTFKYLKINAMDENISMDKEFINKLTEIVQANLSNEKFNVEELIKAAGLSSSTVHRRLRKITHKSISQFIREIRLQRAMEMLKNNIGTASEIAYKTGFGSPTYFNKCFHEFYGYTPGEAKKKASEKAIESNADDPERSSWSDHSLKTGFAKLSFQKDSYFRNFLITSTVIISGILLISFIDNTFFKIPEDFKSNVELPSRNNSPSNPDAYSINGTMNKNLNNLQENKNLSSNSITSDQDPVPIMFDTWKVTLRPGVTMGQYVDFLKTKLVPEYDKNSPGSKLFIACRGTWLNQNINAFCYYFESWKVYYSYYPNGTEMSAERKAGMDRLKQEVSTYVLNYERVEIDSPGNWFWDMLDSLQHLYTYN